MSTDQDKIKHSRRLHNDERAVNRQLKIAQAHGISVTEPHKYAKHHVLNCGDPKCIYCMNPRKYGEKTIQEQRMEQDTGWTDEDTDQDTNEDNIGTNNDKPI